MTSETELLVSRLRAAGCVFADDEAALILEAAGADPQRLEQLTAARVTGAPLEQVLGWAELWGRRWTVAPGVFVPRRRSELLVAEAWAHLRGQPRTWPPTWPGSGATDRDETGAAASRTSVVVDLCCGCGALGGSVALDLAGAGADVELHASDVDPAATECARRNLVRLAVGHDPETGRPTAVGHGSRTARPTAGAQESRTGRLTAVVHDGDLDSPLPDSLRGRVDILLCNAPYVPTEAIALMPREARDHEPQLALDGGTDGLGILRRAIAAAPTWLRPGGTEAAGTGSADPGGVLLFEVGHDQTEAAEAAVREAGLTPRTVSDDTFDATMIMAHPAPTRRLVADSATDSAPTADSRSAGPGRPWTAA